MNVICSDKTGTLTEEIVQLQMLGTWNIHQGHKLAEKIEKDIRMLFPDTHTTVFTHFEPAGDPESMLDISIDRK
jgi:magnesium-transporting ATPase (P-type)